MVDQEEIAARLRAAASGWTTVRGTFRTWRDRTLATRAFMTWHDIDPETLQGRSPGSIVVTAVREDAGGSDGSRVEHVLRVYAADHGRRRRAEAISRTAAEQWMPDLVVVDEPWFWARTGDHVQTNGGNPRSTHGGTDFVLLLAPSEVPSGFDLTATAATETVAGRECDVVVAVPWEIAPSVTIPEAEVFGMVSGGREYRLCLDRQTSTLMRVTKIVDGEPAEIAEFLDITFDEPLDEGLFQPLI